MRSRYSAYALGLVDYIIATTHPQNPNYQQDKQKWRREILAFSQGTRFLGLEILEAKGDTVTFRAILEGGASFTEKSRFQQVEESWFYLSGHIIK